MNRLNSLFICLSIFVSTLSFGQETYYNKIVINEFMASNTTFIADPHGEYDDWVEIYNASDETFNLEGFFLTDKRSEPTNFEFPSTEIQPGEYIIVWLDSDLNQSGLHADFQLNAEGDKIYLMDTDTTVIDHIRYVNAVTDSSIGRYPNGIGVKRSMSPSYNATNVAFDNYGLVINEVMAKNQAGPQDENNEYDDFVELYNNSVEPININGYFLTNKSSNADKYPITADVEIAAGAYQIFWLDNQDIQGLLHCNFNLEGSGDDLMICDTDTATVDYVRMGAQAENETFGRWPNGTGGFKSLNATFNGENSNGIGLSEIEGGQLEIFQNPVSEVLTFSYSLQEPFVLRIFNVKGVMVKSVSIDGSIPEIQVDIQDLAAGMYYARTNGTSLLEFVVE